MNPLARWIWEHSASGLNKVELQSLLSSQTDPDSQLVEELFAAWESVGIAPSLSVAPSKEGQFHTVFWLGGRRMRLASANQDLFQPIRDCLSHLIDDNHTGPVACTVTVSHDGKEGYAIFKNQERIRRSASINDLIVEAIWEVVEIGCDIPGRLMTIHGGAVAKEGVCGILAGAGGSGKTTLTAGLAANGFALIADDVVPVVSGCGLFSPVPMSMCIKAGSWPVLDGLYPEARTIPTYHRFGKPVRFYPPPSSAVPEPTHRFRVNTVLFPQYTPGILPQLVPIPPYEILAELVKSNSIIDSWDAERLAEVAAWVSGLDGYRIFYPDLSSGIDLVGRIFRDYPLR